MKPAPGFMAAPTGKESFRTPRCVHVMRPSRGRRVIHEVLGDIDRRGGCQTSLVPTRIILLSHGKAVWPSRSGMVSLPSGQGIRVFAPRMKAVLLRAYVIHQHRDARA